MKHDTPSATAALVLKALLFAAHDRAHARLVSTEAARWSRLMALKILRWPRLFLFAARSPLCRWLFQTAERMLNPGFILHVAARKAFIDRLARTAIDAGAAQLIVVGAGYDTLALRIAASYPRVRCYEIDHPTTQEAKRGALAAAAVPVNWWLVPADLSVRSFAEVSAELPRFDAGDNTLVVMEGVLMYLPAAVVAKFFTELAARFRGGVTCIFTFMERGAGGDIQFKTAHPWVNWWLQRKRERFLWGIERTRIADFLADSGFINAVTYGKAEFAHVLFADDPPRLAEGELIGMAAAPLS